VSKVLDAFAILAWMQGEAGFQEVRALLSLAARSELTVYLSVINAGEVYYRLYKSSGEMQASHFLKALQKKEFPWLLVPAGTKRVWQAAALKGRYRLSYADAFAVGLSLEMNATLVTGDPEILALADQGVVNVDPLKKH